MEISGDTRFVIGEDYISFLQEQAQAGNIQLPGTIISYHDYRHFLSDATPQSDPNGWLFNENMADVFYDHSVAASGLTPETMSPDMIEDGTVADAITEIREELQWITENNYPVTIMAEAGGQGIVAHGDYEWTDDVQGLMDELTAGTVNAADLPGTPQDYERIILPHELTHVGQGAVPDGEPDMAVNEFEADTNAFSIYYDSYQEGLVTDPAAPHAFRATRAISTVMGVDGDRYRLNGVTSLPGETDVVNGDIAGSTANVNAALDKFYNSIAEDVGNKPPYDPKNAALDAIHEQPDLAYNKAQEMLGAGAFDDNPQGKALMENFVDGAQRYAPETFDVQPDAIPQQQPEVVQDLANEYAPSPAQPTIPVFPIPDTAPPLTTP